MNKDVTAKSMLQIKDILLKSDKLKRSAENNTAKDFEYAYFDNLDDALISGLSQNRDFYTLLLNNEEIKREVMGIFMDDIYHDLRKSKGLKPYPLATDVVSQKKVADH